MATPGPLKRRPWRWIREELLRRAKLSFQVDKGGVSPI